ncbi:MAG: 50S ribosomal protein L4 [Candidatus Nezhaarchaeota archaeon]|nr:50S ribosomal protein L4 [Candidatus Nezhaarchaeota archaeon]
MTAPVYSLEGKPVGEVELPSVFETPVRPDVIQRAFLAALTARIQPQGRDLMAGKRTTAESWGVGYGIARVPRVKGSTRAALAPMTVGGRRAHPPRGEKIVRERINVKERRLATASAIAATADRRWVEARGHRLSVDLRLPIVVVDEIEALTTAVEAKSFLKRIGLWSDVERASQGAKVRAGRGKMRGRRYKEPKSLLIVIGQDKGARKAFRNFPGVDVVHAKSLSVVHLAPGGTPGRLTVYSQSALAELARWRL